MLTIDSGHHDGSMVLVVISWSLWENATKPGKMHNDVQHIITHKSKHINNNTQPYHL